MTKHAFPLVADGEPIIESARQMALYENEDLITNIAGSYQDKHYDDIIRDHQFVEKAPVVPKESLHHSPAVNEDHSYAQKARRQAKQAVKEKRQAYIAKNMAYNPKQATKKGQSRVVSSKKPATELSRFTEKLNQESYILAELPRQYKEPQNTSQAAVKKNNYDFLKRSQIYNHQEDRDHREKTIAQELNLSRFEDIK